MQDAGLIGHCEGKYAKQGTKDGIQVDGRPSAGTSRKLEPSSEWRRSNKNQTFEEVMNDLDLIRIGTAALMMSFIISTAQYEIIRVKSLPFPLFVVSLQP